MWTLPPIPELTENEKKMPVSKYYMPMVMTNPVTWQLVKKGPVDPADMITAENFKDMILVEGYPEVVSGWCMMPDGTGTYAQYQVDNGKIPPELNRWWHQWLNVPPKSTLPGEGNIKHKIWMPYDHIDHYYVEDTPNASGKRDSYSYEKLDAGGLVPGLGSAYGGSIRHNLNPRELGFTDEELEFYASKGIRLTAAWESFDFPGSHFVFGYSRPHPLGGTESFTREWIGWKPVDGKLVRDDFPCDNDYLKGILLHNLLEHSHLPRFLLELYEEYKDKPLDAD